MRRAPRARGGRGQRGTSVRGLVAVGSVVALVAITAGLSMGVGAFAGHTPGAGPELASRPDASAADTGSSGTPDDDPCGCAGDYVPMKDAGPALSNPAVVTYDGKKPSDGYSPSKKYRATLGDDRATVTRLSDGSTALTVTLPSDYAGMAFSPDDDRFLLYTFESFTLYDLTSGQQIYHDDDGTVLGFSPQRSYLAIDDVLNGALKILDIGTGTLVSFGGAQEIPGPVTFGFNQQDKQLLVWTDPGAGTSTAPGHATLYRVPDGTTAWSTTYSALPAFDFSPHGTYLEQKTVTYPSHVTVAVWSTADGHKVWNTQYDFYIPPDTGGGKSGGKSSASGSSATSASTSTSSATSTASQTRSSSASTSSGASESATSSSSSGSGASSTGSSATCAPSSVAASSTATTTKQPSCGSHPKSHGSKGSTSPAEDVSGFGPDDSVWIDDHLADDSKNELIVANMTTGTQLMTEPIPRVATLLFSPCGDTLAVMREISPTNVDTYYADLYNTADGKSLTGGHRTVSQHPVFRATDDSQIIDDGGEASAIAPNLLCQKISLVGNDTIMGGDPTDYTAKLPHPAPLGGLTYTVASDADTLQPASSVTFAQGATTASLHVASSPAAADGPVTLTFSLSHAAAKVDSKGRYVIFTATTTLKATETVQSDPVDYLSVSPSDVYGASDPATARAPVVTKVYLDKPAPASGIEIQLATDNDAVTVPDTVTVAQGSPRRRPM